jgi:multisubunit Na+/H+ antiporter MnhE subunit
LQTTPLQRALLWLSQLVLLTVLWFLLVGKLDWQEFSVGAVCVVLATLAFLRARTLRLVSFAPKATWLTHVWGLPYQVLRDSLTVISALFGKAKPSGKFSSASFNAGGDDPSSSAKRALAAGLTSLPPNSIVVEISREEDTVLYHELVPQGTTPEPANTLGKE